MTAVVVDIIARPVGKIYICAIYEADQVSQVVVAMDENYLLSARRLPDYVPYMHSK